MLLRAAAWAAERRLRREGLRRTTRFVPVPVADGVPLALSMSTLTNREPSGEVGVPLVLFHGLGSSDYTWAKLLPDLAARGEVWAPDWPGFGHSGLPEARQGLSFRELVAAGIGFLERVAPQGAVVVGASMGGWVAGKIATRRPDLVQHLVLVNSAGILTGEIFRQRDLFSPTDRRGIRELWQKMWHRVPGFLPVVSGEFLRVLRSGPVQRFMSDVVEQDFLNDDLAGWPMPVTVVWGLADDLFGRAPLEAFRRDIRNVDVVEVEACGHVPQMERPEAVLPVLTRVWTGRAEAGRHERTHLRDAASGISG